MSTKLTQILSDRILVNSFLLLAFLISVSGSAAASVSTQQSEAMKDMADNGERANHLYKFRIEHGQFRTSSGENRTYSLYIPEPTTGLAPGPFPLVVLIHGFLMTGYQHSGNAENFAKHGFIAFTPDLTKILLGDDTRMSNVRDVLDEIRWLTDNKIDGQGPLHGLVDANRVGIAGNSAGGAVCLEVMLEAQKAQVPIKAMCALDGVPWDRSWDRVGQLESVRLLSLRAEPALCNYHAKILRCFASLKFRYDDVKINGAHHCDVENPSTFGCKCVCGTSNEKYRGLFQRLTYLFFRDSLRGPSLDPEQDNFAQAVHDLQRSGQVLAKLDQLEPPALASTEHTK